MMSEWYLLALIVLLVMWILIIGTRLKQLRKQYVAVMGNTGVANMEDVVVDIKKQLDMQKQMIDSLQSQLSEVQSEIPRMKSKVGIQRYNAFSEKGSNMSFSLAIVNEHRDGAVFSGLHSRDNTYVYAKPVEKGDSPYPLTPEERKAIQEAK